MAIQDFQDKVILIKYGGNAMINEGLKRAVLEDVVSLKKQGLKVILCHGGGPNINRLLEKLDIEIKFVEGLRYTSKEVLDVVKMVLIGEVNSELTSTLNSLGIKAVGLSGISDTMLKSQKKCGVDLGFTGEVSSVNPQLINLLLANDYVPVIAPLGDDGLGNSYNINGDIAAGKLAGSLKVDKFILLTDIEGLCNNIELKDVISYLNIDDIQLLKDKGVISGGMIPKIDCCKEAIEAGVHNVHIIDGRIPHNIINLFNGEVGTTVGKDHPSVGLK